MAVNLNGLDNNMRGFFTSDSVASDISRPYLFRIYIPTTDASGYESGSGLLTAWARSTNLPKYTLSTKEVDFQGQKIRLAGPAEFDGSWTVKFLLDETHSLRHAFLGWMQSAYDANKMHHTAPSEYKRNNIKVEQVSKNGETIVTYNFVGAFPKEVGEIALSQSEVNPSEFDVIFSYDYFVVGIGTLNTDAQAGDSAGTQPTVQPLP